MLCYLVVVRCSKFVSYAEWYSDLARAHVTQARGVLFNSVRPFLCPVLSKKVRMQTRAYKNCTNVPSFYLRKHYLIGRGSLFCWKDEPNARPRTGGEAEAETEVDGEHDMGGSPMSVQQAFTEIIVRDDLTLERYHVR
jgi:tRNA-splicing endonuclease subunit Sen54